MKSQPRRHTQGILLIVLAALGAGLLMWERDASRVNGLELYREASAAGGATVDPSFESPSRLLGFARRAPLAELARFLERTAQVDDPALRFELRQALLRQWAQFDGAAALGYLAILPETERSPLLLDVIVEEWAEANPAAAIDWFGSVSAAAWRERASLALGVGLSRQPLATAEARLRSIEDLSARHAVCRTIVEQWKSRDPASAAHLVLAAAGSEEQSDLLGVVMPEWAQIDFQTALQWAQGLPASPVQTSALIHLGYAWVETDPAGAAAFAGALPPGNEQFVGTLASQWAHRDPRAAADWTLRLPEGASRDTALVSLLAVWAQTDPHAAVVFLLDLGNAPTEAFISAVSAWANNDPRRSAEWVANFPAGPLRDYAIENVVYAWTQSDAVAAVAWVQRLPAGAHRDAALYASAGSLVDSDPDLAVQLAAGIADATLRGRQTERAALTWLALEPHAARAWIDQSNLPPLAKHRLRVAVPR